MAGNGFPDIKITAIDFDRRKSQPGESDLWHGTGNVQVFPGPKPTAKPTPK
jgi:hypothetical protein